MHSASTAPRLLSTTEVLRDHLPLSRPTFYKLIHGGKIRAVRVGHRIFVPADAIQEFLTSCGVAE